MGDYVINHNQMKYAFSWHRQRSIGRWRRPAVYSAYILVSKDFLSLAIAVAFIIGLFAIYGHLLRVNDMTKPAVTWEEGR